MDQGVLQWFGRVERMGEERLAARVYESDVRGTGRSERPRTGWIDSAKDVLHVRDLDIQKVRVCGV